MNKYSYRRIIIGLGFGCLVFLLVWGIFLEPTLLEVNHEEVTLGNLSEEHMITKIGFLSDFQVGMYLGNESTIDKAVDEIINNRPDLVLLGGDYIYHPTEDDSLKEAEAEWTQEDLKKNDEARTGGSR